MSRWRGSTASVPCPRSPTRTPRPSSRRAAPRSALRAGRTTPHGIAELAARSATPPESGACRPESSRMRPAARDSQRPRRASLADTLALRLSRLDLPRDRLRLQEEAEVIAAARFRVGARHVEAAERMDADQRAGALAVQIQIADEELLTGALELLLVVGEDGAGEAELRVVRDPQRVFEVLRFADREHRTEDLFLRDRRLRVDVGDDGRLDEVALLVAHVAAGDETSLTLAALDVLLDLLHRLLADDRADLRLRRLRGTDLQRLRLLGDHRHELAVDRLAADR